MHEQTLNIIHFKQVQFVKVTIVLYSRFEIVYARTVFSYT